jgi:hypothetical protein
MQPDWSSWRITSILYLLLTPSPVSTLLHIGRLTPHFSPSTRPTTTPSRIPTFNVFSRDSNHPQTCLPSSCTTATSRTSPLPPSTQSTPTSTTPLLTPTTSHHQPGTLAINHVHVNLNTPSMVVTSTVASAACPASNMIAQSAGKTTTRRQNAARIRIKHTLLTK